jgi:ribonuclease P protein component
MLPSENRLKSVYFKSVKKKGKVTQDKDFAVSIYKRNDKKKSRFGVVVSAKISSIAVHRNRIKRAIFETVRRNLYRVPYNYDMIFLPKKTIAKKTTDEIMKQVESFLKDRFKP